MSDRLFGARTLLFVPGDQPSKLDKAYASSADAIIVDLEDAVRPAQRPAARHLVAEWVSGLPRSGHSPLVLVRCNGAGTVDHQADLDALAGLPLDGIVLPKFGDIDSYRAAAVLAPLPVVAIVETARGMLNIMGTGPPPDNVRRLAFGAGDFSADIGVRWQKSNPAILIARCQLVWSSRAHGLRAPIDTAFPWLDDEAGLAEEARVAATIGYSGKFCIHPGQLDVVKSAMSITADEQAWARRILDAWAGAVDGTAGAFRLGEEMIDEAVVKRARNVLRDSEN
ncbi:MAG: citrate lyase subunit beta / citryl-CoA lyase [Ilumatobacteraceae bacterium]